MNFVVYILFVVKCNS